MNAKYLTTDILITSQVVCHFVLKVFVVDYDIDDSIEVDFIETPCLRVAIFWHVTFGDFKYIFAVPLF